MHCTLVGVACMRVWLNAVQATPINVQRNNNHCYRTGIVIEPVLLSFVL